MFVLVDEINRALIFSLFYRRNEPVDNDPRVDARSKEYLRQVADGRTDLIVVGVELIIREKPGPKL